MTTKIYHLPVLKSCSYYLPKGRGSGEIHVIKIQETERARGGLLSSSNLTTTGGLDGESTGATGVGGKNTPWLMYGDVMLRYMT